VASARPRAASALDPPSTITSPPALSHCVAEQQPRSVAGEVYFFWLPLIPVAFVTAALPACLTALPASRTADAALLAALPAARFPPLQTAPCSGFVHAWPRPSSPLPIDLPWFAPSRFSCFRLTSNN